MTNYLLYLTPTYSQFHLPELRAILAPYKYDLKLFHLPFYTLSCDLEAIKILLTKSILLKCITCLDLENYDRITYKIKVISHGSHVIATEKEKIIQSYLNHFTNSFINSTSPDVTMLIFKINGKIIPSILVGYSNRKLMLKYKVPNRPFIGNTMMDWELSIIMANLCMRSSTNIINQTVMDPFAGSCGILMAFAYFNTYCVAVDSNRKAYLGTRRNIRNNSKTSLFGTNINDNFDFINKRSYLLLALVADSFKLDFMLKVDFIATDPPYGDREGLYGKILPNYIERLKIICDVNLNMHGFVAFWVLDEDHEYVNNIFKDYEKIEMIKEKKRFFTRVLFVFRKIY